ncbi:exopolysaccharide biosynthesis protein [Aliishimia ponticola]|uniref:Exopolysaccharide biosynthesis protein n=1 Tax=Aliishimia ponticola TaxID=2499833 RepID=A0A4S4N872_9RHOB|nr:exopolysaccharide biosynthesis protein [Aliishimia ponticola]THH34755.1 exopolysaccharide biosynthesis protein [Aliishimia ponticola]
MSDTETTITELLDQVDAATQAPPVDVRSIMDQLGERSFAPLILVIGLLMVSPLSGIPGSPTISALLISLIGIQALIGRKHLWMPNALLNRTVPEETLRKAVAWLRRPAAWFDRHSHKRWPLFTVKPARWATMATCVCFTWFWPFLELLPFVTSFGAGAISLLSFGLLTRDGLYVLLGFAVVAISTTVAATLLLG